MATGQWATGQAGLLDMFALVPRGTSPTASSARARNAIELEINKYRGVNFLHLHYNTGLVYRVPSWCLIQTMLPSRLIDAARDSPGSQIFNTSRLLVDT